MFGLNFNLLDQSIAGVPRIQQSEATAITNNFLARYMSYLDTHISEFPISIQNKIEIIKSANYACPAYPNSYYTHFGVKAGATGSTSSANNRESSNAHASMKNNQSNITTSSSIVGTIYLNYGKMPCDGSTRQHQTPALSREESIVKIQLWYKAFFISKRALLQIVNQVVADPSHMSLSRQEKHRLRAYRKVYYLLAHSYLLHFYDISIALKKGRELFMRKIIDDIVSDVSERQARSTLALRLYSNQSNSSTGNASPVNPGFSPIGSSGKHQSSKEKSLSSRFLKAAGNALSFNMNYGTEDEGEETAEYMEDGLSPKKGAGGGAMSSLMKSFMGGAKS